MTRIAALVLDLALVGFQAWWFQRETPTERRLGEVARSIARADVDVRCPSLWKRLLDVSSFGGTAHVDASGRPTHAELRHEICETFDALAGKGGVAERLTPRYARAAPAPSSAGFHVRAS